MESKPVRIMLVDDHQVMLIGLRTLFEAVAGFDVIAEADTVSSAVAEARRTQPDVVLMDVRLPDGSGIEACREIRSDHPAIRVLMLTSYDDEEAVLGSIMAGAAGYVLKHTDPARLIDAVETVARNESLLDPAITQTTLKWIRGQASATQQRDPRSALSEQERRMLPLIAQGKTNREIAVEIGLSEATVKTYISRVLQKLNLARRAEIAAYITRQESEPDLPQQG